MPLLLEARGLHKAYNVPVLVDFDFELRRGEVHALIGSNGAGKSTFAKILCGLTGRDAGELLIEGGSYHPTSRHEATAQGVVMVLQELNIIPTLSVAENLFFDRLPNRAGIINRRKLNELARAALAQVGLEQLDPDTPAGSLGVGKQQLVEIASALAQNCRVLILDEPSAALTASETEELFSRIEDLQQKGVGIIYVSHRMDEIRRIADRATVLRDGRRIATHEAKDMDLTLVISQMAGREQAAAAAQRKPAAVGDVALSVHGLSAGKAVVGVSLEVRKGEIVGVAGLVGSGRTELLRAIYGADAKDGGEISVNGARVKIRRPHDAVTAGIGMAPEDRKEQALLLEQSISVNATLATHGKFSRFGRLDEKAERKATDASCQELEMKHSGLERPVGELSGGNQQKAVMARWLLRDPAVLLLDEPTRGIDVAAKQTIYGLLHKLADSGKALLVVSSELPELMAICDRILVMSAGRLVGEFTPPDWSEEAITGAAFHGYLGAPPSSET